MRARCGFVNGCVHVSDYVPGHPANKGTLTKQQLSRTTVQETSCDVVQLCYDERLQYYAFKELEENSAASPRAVLQVELWYRCMNVLILLSSLIVTSERLVSLSVPP